MELRIAGPGYGTDTLPLIFDFVNIANGLHVVDASKGNSKVTPMERVAPDEATTLAYMAKAEQMVRRITGTHPSSLGLLPALYFYSATNRHQPTSVLAVAALIMEMDARDAYIEFTDVRASFENFLFAHRSLIGQFTYKYGSMAKGYRQLKNYLAFVLEQCAHAKSESEVLDAIAAEPTFKFLSLEPPLKSVQAKPFSSAAKRHSFITEAISSARICDLCGARLDSKSMHLGHVVDRMRGGSGDLENSSWQHPFCDSTYKAYLEKAGRL